MVAGAGSTIAQQKAASEVVTSSTPIYGDVLNTEKYNAFVAQKQAEFNARVAQKQAQEQAQTNARIAERNANFVGREKFIQPLEAKDRSFAGKRTEIERGAQEALVTRANQDIQDYSDAEFAKTQKETEGAKAQFTERQVVGYETTTWQVEKQNDTLAPSTATRAPFANTSEGQKAQQQYDAKVQANKVNYPVKAPYANTKEGFIAQQKAEAKQIALQRIQDAKITVDERRQTISNKLNNATPWGAVGNLVNQIKQGLTGAGQDISTIPANMKKELDSVPDAQTTNPKANLSYKIGTLLKQGFFSVPQQASGIAKTINPNFKGQANYETFKSGQLLQDIPVAVAAGGVLAVESQAQVISDPKGAIKGFSQKPIESVGAMGPFILAGKLGKGPIGKITENAKNVTLNKIKSVKAGFVEPDVPKTTFKSGEQVGFINDIHENPIAGDLPLEKLDTGKKTVFQTRTFPEVPATENLKPGESLLAVQSPTSTHWGLPIKGQTYFQPFENLYLSARQFGAEGFSSLKSAYDNLSFSILPKTQRTQIFLGEGPSELIKGIKEGRDNVNRANAVKSLSDPELGGKFLIPAENAIKRAEERQTALQSQGVLKGTTQKVSGSKIKILKKLPESRFYDIKKLPFKLDKTFLQGIYEKSGLGRDWKVADTYKIKVTRPRGRPALIKDISPRERPTAIVEKEGKVLLVQERTGEYGLVGGGRDYVFKPDYYKDSKVNMRGGRWMPEELTDSISREAKEEIGLKLSNFKKTRISDIKSDPYLASSGFVQQDLFRVYTAKGKGINLKAEGFTSGEIKGIKWIDKNDFSKMKKSDLTSGTKEILSRYYGETKTRAPRVSLSNRETFAGASSINRGSLAYDKAYSPRRNVSLMDKLDKYAQTSNLNPLSSYYSGSSSKNEKTPIGGSSGSYNVPSNERDDIISSGGGDGEKLTVSSSQTYENVGGYRSLYGVGGKIYESPLHEPKYTVSLPQQILPWGPIEKPRRRSFNPPNERRKKRKPAFDLVIRSHGKNKLVARRLDFSRAIGRGKVITENTARRTFGLRANGFVEVEEGQGFRQDLNRFRTPAKRSSLNKLGDFVFVQKTKYSISSRGEKQELKNARRRRF